MGAGPAWLHTCMLLMKHMYCEQDHGQYSVVICYKTYLCTNNCHLKLTVLFIIMNIKLYCSHTCQIRDKKYKMICFKSLFAHLIILTLTARDEFGKYIKCQILQFGILVWYKMDQTSQSNSSDLLLYLEWLYGWSPRYNFKFECKGIGKYGEHMLLMQSNIWKIL